MSPGCRDLAHLGVPSGAQPLLAPLVGGEVQEGCGYGAQDGSCHAQVYVLRALHWQRDLILADFEGGSLDQAMYKGLPAAPCKLPHQHGSEREL